MKKIVSFFLCLFIAISILSVSALAMEFPELDILESAVAAVENAAAPEPEVIEPEVRDVSLPVRTAEAGGQGLFAETGVTHATEGEEVSFASAGVSAPVLYASSYTPADLVQLMKFIVGTESSFDASTADINGDGEADILDVIRLLTICAENPGLAPEGHTGFYEAEDGKLYFYDDNGQMLVNSWLEYDGKVYCFGEDGAALTGFWTIGEEVYYFWSEGHMHTGWLRDGEDLLYFKEDGTMAWSEWLEVDGVERFFGEDGAMAVGWWLIDETNVYYFHEDGSKHTGWLEEDGEKYYFRADGTAVCYDWLELDGEWYFFNGDGARLTEGFWEIEEGKVYCFNADGTMHTGWKKYDGEWFYFNSYMVTSKWKEIDGEWYYFGSDGVMYHDTWFKYGGYRYYFKSSGAMACNETLYLKDPDVPGLKRYFTFDSEGHGKGQF